MNVYSGILENHNGNKFEEVRPNAINVSATEDDDSHRLSFAPPCYTFAYLLVSTRQDPASLFSSDLQQDLDASFSSDFLPPLTSGIVSSSTTMDVPSDISYKDQSLTLAELSRGERMQHSSATATVQAIPFDLLFPSQAYPPPPPHDSSSCVSKKMIVMGVIMLAVVFSASTVFAYVSLTTSTTTKEENESPTTTLALNDTAPLPSTTSSQSFFNLTVKGSDAVVLANRIDLDIPPLNQDWPENTLIRTDWIPLRVVQETLPPFVPVSCNGATVRLTEPATGTIDFCSADDYGDLTNLICDYLSIGPKGEGTLPISVSSLGGISGYAGPVGALAGVFLDNDVPDGTRFPPSGLDFTGALGHDFTLLAPEIGQVFYIGDGFVNNNQPRVYEAPLGATRLYVGIVDGEWDGLPGYFTNNAGNYQASVRIDCPSN